MYNSYFGFKIKPFQINTDPRFLWLGEAHREALSVLRYGVLECRGFIVLTGDVGTGKTTLLNALFENLPSNLLAARISDPRLDLMDFFNRVAAAFGLDEIFKTKGAFLARFEKFLMHQHYLGKKVLLVVDESQRLTHDLLEEIRALSNLEQPRTKLLNVIFVGQNEFNDLLLERWSRAIRQRITLNFHLDPLNQKDVAEYVWHRQKVAGGQKNLFTKKALARIYDFSGGFPRLINIICDHALLSAYVKSKKYVSGSIVAECARELEISSLRTTQSAEGRNKEQAMGGRKSKSFQKFSKPKRKKRVVLALAGLLIFFVLGYFAYLRLPASAQWLSLLTEKIGMQQTKQAKVQQKPGTPGKSDATRPGFSVSESIQKKKASQSQPELKEKDLFNSSDVAPFPSKKKAQDKKTTQSAEKIHVPAKLTILFQHDGYGLNQRSLEALNQAKSVLRMNPALNARVIGYSDSLGDPRYNQQLSEQRAKIVESYLSGGGISPDRIESKGMGMQNPVAPNKTRSGREQNRRVEVRFYPSRP